MAEVLPLSSRRAPCRTSSRVTVIKIGGSVLTGPAAYREAATFAAARLAEDRDRRLVVVVSAELGVTDALLEAARAIAPDPDPTALDLLWSTGELRSVAMLVLALHAAGLRAVGLNVHQTGLCERAPKSTPPNTDVRPLRLRATLAQGDVIVIPGFLARSAGDEIVSLGRGGSDLTAVLVAGALDAQTCELIKDVPGYFSADPHRDPDARHLASLSYADALDMADRGCDLVQRQALEAAHARRLRLVVRSMGDRRVTVIH